MVDPAALDGDMRTVLGSRPSAGVMAQVDSPGRQRAQSSAFFMRE
jgi:hypothetical protein